jgi:hypothetical protein
MDALGGLGKVASTWREYGEKPYILDNDMRRWRFSPSSFHTLAGSFVHSRKELACAVFSNDASCMQCESAMKAKQARSTRHQGHHPAQDRESSANTRTEPGGEGARSSPLQVHLAKIVVEIIIPTLP